jgi:hypothetical protein
MAFKNVHRTYVPILCSVFQSMAGRSSFVLFFVFSFLPILHWTASVPLALFPARAKTRLSILQLGDRWGFAVSFPVGPLHAIVPKSAPIPAVSPMASAPHKVTRMAPVIIEAPPARAANPPNDVRNTSDVPATAGIRLVSGTMVAVNRGMAAPTAKLPADANAA